MKRANGSSKYNFPTSDKRYRQIASAINELHGSMEHEEALKAYRKLCNLIDDLFQNQILRIEFDPYYEGHHHYGLDLIFPEGEKNENTD